MAGAPAPAPFPGRPALPRPPESGGRRLRRLRALRLHRPGGRWRDPHPHPRAGEDPRGAERRGSGCDLGSTGELCLQSVQCKSGCCHRQDGLSLARCAPKAAESQDCSPKSLYGVYYRCPCESGLTCDADKTIIGSITNSDFGLCTDPNESR
ncbi:colipase isoform X1 [Patagioenas fasciata]|uniref:colipase isoform X1 n=1 Tax=Patagioenas fasciata TaxID=372321 RepID=UPI0032E8BAF6